MLGNNDKLSSFHIWFQEAKLERSTLEINQSQTRTFDAVEIKLKVSPSPSKPDSNDKEGEEVNITPAIEQSWVTLISIRDSGPARVRRSPSWVRTETFLQTALQYLMFFQFWLRFPWNDTRPERTPGWGVKENYFILMENISIWNV